ncbi:hypothetical protein ACSLGF_17125 [Bacillus sp. A015]
MSSRNVVGYHGTFEEHLDSILSDGFKPEKRKNHWLGQGTYFYTDKKLAHWWISKNSQTDPLKQKIKSNPVIIKANIEEKADKFLDLDSPEGVDYFYECIKNYSSAIKKLYLTDNEDINRCAIIDFLTRVYKWNVIIMTFEKNTHKPSYGKIDTIAFDSKVIPLNVHYKETQVCIKDEKCIKSKEIEYPTKEYSYPKKIRFDYANN